MFNLGVLKREVLELGLVLHWLAPDVHIFDTYPSLL